MRRALVREYGPRCMRCGDDKSQPHDDPALTIDHVVPLRAGGTDDFGNLQLLCAECHWEVDHPRKGGARPEKRDYRPAPGLQASRGHLKGQAIDSTGVDVDT